MASQVMSGAAGVVGLGRGEETGAVEEEGRAPMKDERVDGVKDEVVEEYLRAKVTAQGEV